MRVWNRVSKYLWTALLAAALLALTSGRHGLTADLYRVAVVAGCLYIVSPNRNTVRNIVARITRKGSK